jgi:hypothetical protein
MRAALATPGGSVEVCPDEGTVGGLRRQRSWNHYRTYCHRPNLPSSDILMRGPVLTPCAPVRATACARRVY